MRVLLNGRDIGALDPRLEGRLWGRRNQRLIEGVALSADESLAARAQQLRRLLGAAAALVAVLLTLNLVVLAARAPQAMGYVVPIVAIIAGAVTGLFWLLYAVMLGAHRRRVAARGWPGPGLATTVRLDASGLTVDGRTSPWSGLRVEEVGIRERQGGERRVTYVEFMTLSDGRRPIRLDALFLSNGRAVLEQAWFRIRALETGG